MTIRLLLFITLLCTISTTCGLEGMIDFQKFVDKADTYGYTYLSEFKLIETKLGVLSTEFNLTDFKKTEKPKNTNLKKIINLIFNINFIPTSYDARDAHPECDSIKLIRDQGICGTGWAISAASTLSDRTCIWSKGKFNEMLSSNYILGCNHPWAYRGGIKEAWTFFQEKGCITGGDFGSDEGCQPYTIYSCDWPTKIPCSPPYSVGICNIIKPECKGIVCSNKFYSFNETNIVKVSKIYRIGDPDNSLLNEFKIREEIFYNGPVQAGFWVHKDFLMYKSGIYRREFDIYDPPLGVHSVKIIGWGEENGLKYWLVSNSWGEEWGENGLFRIIRGEDNCFIEHEVWAGIPILP